MLLLVSGRVVEIISLFSFFVLWLQPFGVHFATWYRADSRGILSSPCCQKLRIEKLKCSNVSRLDDIYILYIYILYIYLCVLIKTISKKNNLCFHDVFYTSIISHVPYSLLCDTTLFYIHIELLALTCAYRRSILLMRVLTEIPIGNSMLVLRGFRKVCPATVARRCWPP